MLTVEQMQRHIAAGTKVLDIYSSARWFKVVTASGVMLWLVLMYGLTRIVS